MSSCVGRYTTAGLSHRLGGQRRSLTGWLVSFVRGIRSERKSAAQAEVSWSAERRLAVYDAISASPYVQIALDLKMRPFDTSHLGGDQFAAVLAGASPTEAYN